MYNHSYILHAKLFLLYVNECFACICTTWVPVECLETDGWEPPYAFWKLNLGPMQNQHVGLER